jgi:DNA-binding XRE family transcriptional regulator
MPNLVGQNIRRHRKACGLSQEELAKEMFQDARRQTYVSAVERGVYTPDLPNLVLFATALRCTLSDIQPLICCMPAREIA